MIGSIAYSPSELDPSSWSGRSVFGLVYLIVFGSLLGYSAYVWLLANAPISKVSTYAYVNPVVAIALGVIVLDESVTVRIVAGALLILISVAIVLRREATAAPPLEPGEVVRPDRDPAELAPLAARSAETTAAVETTVGGSPTLLRRRARPAPASSISSDSTGGMSSVVGIR